MTIRALLGVSLLGAVLAALPAADDAAARQPHTVVRAGTIHAVVPRQRAEELDALIRRADAIYQQLAADAGYRIQRPLMVWFADGGDVHNGFSMVVPRPLLRVDLAPPDPNSTIADGHDHLLRTLVHELAHHVSNDRDPIGGRGVLSRIFGRVLPDDPLSLLMAYLTWPPHLTMPPFWHEGLAQWAESSYRGDDGPWAGRASDSLTHMVWRLDAAAGAIPSVDGWTLGYHRWPYGNRAYLYGLAYMRYLVSQRAIDPWQAVDRLARGWAFQFGSVEVEPERRTHEQLLGEARRALLTEQQQALATLRSEAVTTGERLTPPGWQVGTPSWTADGRVIVALRHPWQRARIATLGADGRWRRSGPGAPLLPALRRIEGDSAQISTGSDAQLRGWVRLISDQGDSQDLPLRLLMPSARRLADGGLDLVGVAVDAPQRLERVKLDAKHRILHRERIAEVDGRPWSPAWQPGHERLAWVETDVTGSRLVVAKADGSERQLLMQVAGRLLHPTWLPDGRRLIVCADHSGVTNAYLVDSEAEANTATPVTNVLGGVLAAVPSPDGRELVIRDHDHHGPFLARLPLDPASWPARVPTLTLAPQGEGWRRPLAVAAAATEPLPQHAYRGLFQIRPWYWTPTTLATIEGGQGLAAAAGDPLMTHILRLGVGFGATYDEPVGQFQWSYHGWPVDLGLSAWRVERVYANALLHPSNRRYDYGETGEGLQLSVGRSISGFAAQWSAELRIGVEEREAIPEAEREYAEEPLVSNLPFTGQDRYLELALGVDTRFLPADAFAPTDGLGVELILRHSGLGGELERDSATLATSLTVSTWPSAGHQINLAGRLGWSEGERNLQEAFAIGGFAGQTLPRGYLDRVATGQHLVGWGAAYRAPLYRPFSGSGSSPFTHRQLALEVFVEGAKVSQDHAAGDGSWYRSAGAELISEWDFWSLRLQPGLQVARRLDDDEGTAVQFILGFRW